MTATCRPRDRAELSAALEDARARLLAMIVDLDDAQLIVPHRLTLNPFLWEVGHVGWFAEMFLLRRHAGQAPMRADADELWDSIEIEHDTRWDLLLPSRADSLTYLRTVLDRIQERLATVELTPEEWDVHMLVLAHEDMHIEAFAYMRQAMGYARPDLGDASAPELCEAWEGEVEFAGGPFRLGAPREVPFAFDNERDAHEVEVRPFALDKRLVTETEYAHFLDAQGYARQDLWTPQGWAWLQGQALRAPLYWRRDGSAWLRQAWDGEVALEARRPVGHLNAFEAEAYARFVGRRLPTEAEWEFAAAGHPYPWGQAPCADERAALDFAHGDVAPVDACSAGDTALGLRQLIGNLWEWTASPFEPYPGFRPGRYAEYSQPWFGDHRVLRGGSWATAGRLIRTSWRNFYLPGRGDVWSGLRTARDG